LAFSPAPGYAYGGKTVADYANNEKSLARVLQEIKDDLRDFATTRYEMLVAELNEKVRVWKMSLPMLAVGAVFAIGGFFVFTFGLVALFARIIGTEYAWAWAALVVTVIYFAVAGIFSYLGYSEISEIGLAPDRTLRVLKEDQQWIKDQTRAA
jgi:uncharacterized membrane protein YqjE